jgi:hypothetical protein
VALSCSSNQRPRRSSAANSITPPFAAARLP